MRRDPAPADALPAARRSPSGGRLLPWPSLWPATTVWLAACQPDCKWWCSAQSAGWHKQLPCKSVLCGADRGGAAASRRDCSTCSAACHWRSSTTATGPHIKSMPLPKSVQQHRSTGQRQSAGSRCKRPGCSLPSRGSPPPLPTRSPRSKPLTGRPLALERHHPAEHSRVTDLVGARTRHEACLRSEWVDGRRRWAVAAAAGLWKLLPPQPRYGRLPMSCGTQWRVSRGGDRAEEGGGRKGRSRWGGATVPPDP